MTARIGIDQFVQNSLIASAFNEVLCCIRSMWDGFIIGFEYPCDIENIVPSPIGYKSHYFFFAIGVAVLLGSVQVVD